jgi:hypothetical protein
MTMCSRIWSRHGIPGLYTGLTLTGLRCSIGNAAFFGINELCWRYNAREGNGSGKEHSGMQSLVYGGISGCAYWLVCVSVHILMVYLVN